MISVMIPTRGRPDKLLESAHSLLDMASEPDSVEILAAVDSDDRATLADLPTLLRPLILAPVGYERLYVYYNAMAAKAKGDWLMMYGDDCIMQTKGWDNLFKPLNAQKIIYANGTHTSSGNPCFPCISRAFYEEMGCISQFWACDTWLEMAALEYGAMAVSLPFNIKHSLIHKYRGLPNYPVKKDWLINRVREWKESRTHAAAE